ncbi:MAG: FHA domain-containing protein [Vulcanococcus sp.]
MSAPSAAARLVLASDRRKAAPLDAAQPLTIGRAAGNRLCLASADGVSDHHAVVRHSRSHGWVVCDWQSQDGTWLEGQRVRQCRPLGDGDEIRLGLQGPVLVFELVGAAGSGPAAAGQPSASTSGATAATATRSNPARRAVTPAADPLPTAVSRAGSSIGSAGSPSGSHSGRIDFAGRSLEVATIRAAVVRSEPQHPQIFSWWLLLCLGGLLLLPFPLLFWPLQIAALAGWILLGSRKDHTLVVELRDGRALRHRFANRRTALAHRNGIRKAIGQGSEAA